MPCLRPNSMKVRHTGQLLVVANIDMTLVTSFSY